MRASACLVRDDNRVKPPLSRINTSARLTEASLTNASGDGVRVRPLAAGRFADLGGKLLKIGGRLVERVLPLEFGTECDLEQLRRRQPSPLQLIVKIVGQVHLEARHTPNRTPMNQATQPVRREPQLPSNAG